jgi:Protein of unknown function (DUF2786)
MAPEDVVERIRKLLRLAENAGATEAEAASALERASALLLRHNLSMEQIAVSASQREVVGEERIRTGWAGSWRGSLLGVLARHNLCSPFVHRRDRADTVVIVGRPANIEATHAMYDWIAEQLERFAQEEWLVFNRAQREALAKAPGEPWCSECEDWTETYQQRRELLCDICDSSMLPERPLIHGFTWKTAFFRGAVLRISNRLHEQLNAERDAKLVTALVVRTEHENDEYILNRYEELRRGRPRRRGYHAGAYERGKQRGDDVSLGPMSRLKGGGPTSPSGSA